MHPIKCRLVRDLLVQSMISFTVSVSYLLCSLLFFLCISIRHVLVGLASESCFLAAGNSPCFGLCFEVFDELLQVDFENLGVRILPDLALIQYYPGIDSLLLRVSVVLPSR